MAAILPDAALRGCVRELAPGIANAVLERLGFEPARTAARGDVSTLAAFAGAPAAGMPQAAFAALLAARLALLPAVREAAAAGAGFINLRLHDAALDRILPALLALPRQGGEPVPVTIALASMHPEDPVCQVQYAHARCRSVLRAASGMDWPGGWPGGQPGGWPGALPGAGDRAGLADAARGRFAAGPARVLLCWLEHWLRLGAVAEAPPDLARISLYLRDLSGCFDRFWKTSRDDATLRLLHPDQPSLSLAHLALVTATAETIRSGLALLGMAAAEELR